MKVYAAIPEKRQFSLHSPKSAIVPSATCTHDDHFHTGKLIHSQPFYQARLVPMTTISILGSLARVDGEAAGLSRAVYRRSLDKDG